LLEVHERFVTPDSYGRTVTIAGDAAPREYPVGPMEELVKRRVTMRLQNAGVKDIVQALSEIDGLNIVADQALTEEQQVTVNVKDVPLSELLSYIARNMGIAFHLGANTVWVTQSAEPPGSGPKLETRIYSLRQGLTPPPMAGGSGGGSLASRIGGNSGFGGVDSAFAALSGGGGGAAGNSELEQVLATFLTGGPDGATYQVYRERNVVIIRNSIENLRLAEELIREFDQAPKQVLIEARFVTVRDTDLLEFGFQIPEFDLEPKDADVRSTVLTMDSSSVPAAFAKAATGGNVTVTGILGNRTYKAVMHALKEEGKSKTLSAPRVTVVNNGRARLRRGQLMYYFEEYDVAGVATADNTETTIVPTGSPTELELGVTLDVQVNVGNDGRTVMLALAPNITDFAGWENYLSGDGGNNAANPEFSTAMVRLPKVNESSVQTTVVVNSGETVVLGGMLYNSEERSESKVPLLGDIPFLGWLFKHATRETKPEHLLIFVTATVIGPSGEFVQTQAPDAAR
jgi:type II secretory pathway component GspD/PulD (secretin)